MITLTEETEVIFDCYQNSESNCDYAVFSKVNNELNPLWNTDRDGSSSVYFSALGHSGHFSVTYTLPAGTRAIYIKYRKDDSVSVGEDTFTFSLNIPSYLSANPVGDGSTN